MRTLMLSEAAVGCLADNSKSAACREGWVASGLLIVELHCEATLSAYIARLSGEMSYEYEPTSN